MSNKMEIGGGISQFSRLGQRRQLCWGTCIFNLWPWIRPWRNSGVYKICLSSGADPGICVRGGRGGPSIPFPSTSPCLPLQVGPLKPAMEAWGSAVSSHSGGSGRSGSSDRKRIWCTLKLSESQWRQSFWIFWVPCFTVEPSKFRISWYDREWRRQSVAQRGTGAGSASL